MITTTQATTAIDADPLFWRMVDRSGGDGSCWLWTGHRNALGYGTLQRRRVARGPMLATRYVFLLAQGRLPALLVLHSCDNPPCVNPAHLREGTNAENRADAIARGRHVRPPRHVGSAHPRSALTEAQVAEVRTRLALATETHRQIAESLGVARTTVTAIARGQNRRAA